MSAVDRMYCQMDAVSLILREPNTTRVKHAAAMAAVPFMSTAFHVVSNQRRCFTFLNYQEIIILHLCPEILERSTAGCPWQSCR